MIRLERITRRFGAQVLYRDLDWFLKAGSRIGLVGANGSGKTTLLRILAGLDEPDGGAVHRPSRLTVGYLPQEVETVHEGRVVDVVLDGFGEYRELERRMHALGRDMARIDPEDPRLESIAAEYGDVRHRFEALGGETVESRARTILSGLGVPASRFEVPLSTLSGGWRMRVVLARLLLSRPDLLLLDEPTNHLDLEAIDWLETFLEGFEGAYVVVSHDRYFLNRMARRIAELERGQLTEWAGNYDAYLEARTVRDEARERTAERQEKERARVERFVERFRYKASKAKQVQSRIRAMDRVERVETSARGASIRFGFPAAPRSGEEVLRFEGVAKRYGDHEVYADLDLTVRRGQRIALIGPNGTGKSTLLRIACGRLAPDRGRVVPGHNVEIAYYAQHQLDDLEPSRTALEELEAVADAELRPRLRGLLGRFLFRGHDVDKKVAVLSGGEKARLALARMLLRPTNLLLLDEPTNHLDLASREVLEDALAEYGGTLIVVSHDRYFVNRIADHVGVIEDGRVRIEAGDFDRWVEHAREREATAAPADDDVTAAGGARREREARRAEAEERNRRYRERRAVEREMEPVEAEIAELERRLRDLESRQADPAVYADPDAARKVARDKTRVQDWLADRYERWEDLAARLPEDG